MTTLATRPLTNRRDILHALAAYPATIQGIAGAQAVEPKGTIANATNTASSR